MLSDEFLTTLIENTAKAVVAPIDARLAKLETAVSIEIAAKHRRELWVWKIIGITLGLPGTALTIITLFG
jgi:hypothetical protein